MLLLVLIVRTAALAQQEPFDEVMVKDFINHSTLIIEGKRIDMKYPILNAGHYYYLILIKPTSVLSGSCDSSKTYSILIKEGSYSISSDSVLLEDPIIYDPPIDIPQYGIFFINENPPPFPNNIQTQEHNGKIIPTTFNKIFPNATYVNFTYGINYAHSRSPKEKTLQFLLDKFNLKAKPF